MFLYGRNEHRKELDKMETNPPSFTIDELYKRVAKNNHFRGRQRIIDHWFSGDEWVFDSNIKGAYGENLTFHYRDGAALVKEVFHEYAEEYADIRMRYANRTVVELERKD